MQHLDDDVTVGDGGDDGDGDVISVSVEFYLVEAMTSIVEIDGRGRIVKVCGGAA